VVGIDHPAGLAEKVGVVMLRSAYDSKRVAQRFDETRKLIESRAGITVHEQPARGKSRLAQMLDLVQVGDYVSYYAAVLAGADPTPVEAISMLKTELAKLV
jgi:glucose/mannose-6-phosphate isomerase